MTFFHCADSWDCVSSVLLGGCCFGLLIAFVLATRTMLWVSSMRPATSDLVIFALSAVQCMFSCIYYLAADNSSVLLLLLRSLKSFQILLICGALVTLKARSPNGSVARQWRNLFSYTSICIVIVFVLAVLFEPSNPHCRDSSWILLSSSQLALIATLATLTYSLFKRPSNRVPEMQPVVIGSFSSFDPYSPKIDENDKVWTLLGLVGVEAFAGIVALVWDIVFVVSLQKKELHSCSSIDFASLSEFAESVLFFISELIVSFAPQLAVYYVFYWRERQMHQGFVQNWDVDLGAL